MRNICQLLLQAVLISTIAFYGCTVYQKPRPLHDIPFRERSQSKVDGEVRVTVAVLSDEESRQLFGVNIAGPARFSRSKVLVGKTLYLPG